jgi:ribosome maturation factor RimP
MAAKDEFELIRAEQVRVGDRIAWNARTKRNAEVISIDNDGLYLTIRAGSERRMLLPTEPVILVRKVWE